MSLTTTIIDQNIFCYTVLGLHSKELRTDNQTSTSTLMFTAALFAMTKRWE